MLTAYTNRVFFDGTNNNLRRDRDGERIGVDKEIIKSSHNAAESLPEPKRSHSNVARLFEAYATNDTGKGIFSYYIPGVGTRFEQIREFTETPEGKAFAKGGEARIMYALIQIVNSIYAVLTGDARFDPYKVGAMARQYEKLPESSPGDRFTVKKSKILNFFAEHMDDLTGLLQAKPKPVIPNLTLDVFGFSRGSVEAIAFCHLFNDLLVNGRFASIPASINFLGVFDVVASVGISFSASLTTIAPEVMADGHLSWAKRILDPLPSCVRSARHFIAAQEQRMNFPVTTQTGSSDFKQYYFPGVHSDVGG